MKKMEMPAPLALPEELQVTEIAMIDEVLTITAHSTVSELYRKYVKTTCHLIYQEQRQPLGLDDSSEGASAIFRRISTTGCGAVTIAI